MKSIRYTKFELENDVLLMKEKALNFIKELVIYTIVITILVFIFYKLKLINSFGIDYILGLVTGWIVAKVIVLLINKKSNKN